MMNTYHTVNALQNWRQQQDGIAFVPTMGALHAGHLALVDAANASGLPVVVSIFVNPTQFGAGEDLSRYPRPFEKDQALLEAAGVAALFTPSVDEMYPQGHATSVHIAGFDTLCGASRPGHFDGVATVITKFFNILHPTTAYFGEKDYQQLQLIKRLVADLQFDTDVIGVPTVRETDGLALSSRNQYLTTEERQQAAVLPKTLQQLVRALNAGEDVSTSLAAAKQALITGGFHTVEYVQVVDSALKPVMQQPLPDGTRVIVAAKIGKTRLIDNMAVFDGR